MILSATMVCNETHLMIFIMWW